ncbi:MAG: hypothetical protein RM347_026395 [Nostoc sp. ChiQUE02]|nr:hypothetical protein [Nostoc sp. ChiQUE02]MDZ8234760.1 hypothetical protein [Nostoc sp. ChiQUE02]
MSASEVQYLIIDALITLDLLGNTFYDEDSGNWYINIPALSYRYDFTKG